MELDELKQTWSQMETQMNRSLELNARQFKEYRLDKTRSRLNKSLGNPIIDLVGGIIVAGFLGQFVSQNISDIRFLIPGLILSAFNLALIIASSWQIGTTGGLNLSLPVAKLQERVALVRSVRVRVVYWILMASPLTWMPMVIVTAKGLAGVDLYRICSPAYIASNVAFGFGFLALCLWVSKRFKDQLQKNAILRLFSESISGRNLNLACATLGEIRQFQSEFEQG